MDFIKNKKGQIGLMAIVGIGLSILIPSFTGYFAQSQRTDTRIGSVSERVAITEKAISIIEKNSDEMRKDIKEILLRTSKLK